MSKRKRKTQRFVWPKAGLDATDIRKSSILQVDWGDASCDAAWAKESDDLGPVNCTSVGFLMFAKRTHLTLALTISATAQATARMSIPRKWITRIKVLQRAK